MRGLAFLAIWFLSCGLTGKASYYTEASCRREGTSGVWTASGHRYDEQGLTCALRRRDFGKRYRVCLQTNPTRCVVVTHTDYGPGRGPTAKGVVIDLTPAAFERLAPLAHGLVAVTVTPEDT